MKKNQTNRILIILVVLLACISCKTGNEQEIPYSVLKTENFQKRVYGKQTNLYFIENGDVRMAVTNYGGRIVSLCTPDQEGEYADIVLGFKSIDEYLHANEVFHGAIIGRVANRIADGKFVLNGEEYVLPINNKTNHLHGGKMVFTIRFGMLNWFLIHPLSCLISQKMAKWVIPEI